MGRIGIDFKKLWQNLYIDELTPIENGFIKVGLCFVTGLFISMYIED